MHAQWRLHIKISGIPPLRQLIEMLPFIWFTPPYTQASRKAKKIIRLAFSQVSDKDLARHLDFIREHPEAHSYNHLCMYLLMLITVRVRM